MALSFWAYYLALKRHWLGVGILLAFLTAARLPSILVIALCGLEFLRAYDWKPKKLFNKNLLFFLLAPLGFLAYALYLSVVQHDFLGMFHAYQHTNDWPYQVFNPNIIETVARQGYQIVKVVVGLRPFENGLVISTALPLASLVVLGVSSIYLIVKQRARFLPLGIVGILSFIMFTLNSNVVSVHRYLLPSLTIYVAGALFISHKKRTKLLYVWLGLGIVGQFLLYIAFIGFFAG